ncbi:MAG: aminotransferase class V-fold PLP-dependent enzyme [Calditrichia bacterium]|nr:aminotransferase class V-fold PLP-dependent enzyme [Calditrichia bacterium]
MDMDDLAKMVVGYDKKVPLLNGNLVQYINLDNAASTPALTPVMEKVNEAMEWYSSIHRGTGFKSQLCSELFENGREVIAEFVNIDPETHAIIFGKNATEAINKLANRLSISKDELFLVSKMEHHSNDLPWRSNGKVEHINIHPDGRLDEEHLIELLKKYHGKVALVAVTGASNVTGWVNDINRLAEICHEHHTRIMIDAAQLAPHRTINMKSPDDPGHIDFLVFSAHKIYAPLGSGVLIGPKSFFEEGDPDYVGGGTVKIVGLSYAHWAETPEKDEAGSPNTIGVIALAKSLLAIRDLGMKNIAKHEMELTAYILEKMNKLTRIQIYGSKDPSVVENRLGVIAFNVEGMPHALTAAILNYEGGIGVRNGCFCAHPYIKLLMGMDDDQARIIEEQILQGDRSDLPGAVRASFGMYNNTQEIDHFINVLTKIVSDDYQGKYILDRQRGEYHPAGYSPKFHDYFQL